MTALFAVLLFKLLLKSVHLSVFLQYGLGPSVEIPLYLIKIIFRFAILRIPSISHDRGKSPALIKRYNALVFCYWVLVIYYLQQIYHITIHCNLSCLYIKYFVCWLRDEMNISLVVWSAHSHLCLVVLAVPRQVCVPSPPSPLTLPCVDRCTTARRCLGLATCSSTHTSTTTAHR